MQLKPRGHRQNRQLAAMKNTKAVAAIEDT